MNATQSNPATQPKARKPRPKPGRTIRVLEQPSPNDPQGWFAIQIVLTHTTRRTTRTESATYLCREIPAGGMGKACCGYEVEKLSPELQPTGEVYHVLLDGRDCSGTCDCKGGEQHGRCKHREGIQALVGAGQVKPRFRSAGDMAANDPDGFDRHLDSIAGIAGFGVPPGASIDEPPQLDEAAYFDPASDDIHAA